MVASVPLKRMPTTKGRQIAAQARTRGASPNGSARAPTAKWKWSAPRGSLRLVARDRWRNSAPASVHEVGVPLPRASGAPACPRCLSLCKSPFHRSILPHRPAQRPDPVGDDARRHPGERAEQQRDLVALVGGTCSPVTSHSNGGEADRDDGSTPHRLST